MYRLLREPSIRSTGYIAAIAGLFALASIVIHEFGGKIVLQENGIVEWVQIVWLGLTSLVLFSSSRRADVNREFLYALAFLPIIAVVRELDDYSDTLLFHGAWKYIDAAIAGAIIWRLRKDITKILEQFLAFTRTRSFVFMVLGFFVVFAFSRIMGQQSLWRVLLAETYHRKIGRLVEEYMELLGYSFLLVGAIECWYECRTADEKIGQEVTETAQSPVFATGAVMQDKSHKIPA